MKTATGNFPLGWRRRNFAWEQDLDSMIDWAIENELEVIDLGRDADSCTKAVVEAGLRVGTADLTVWGEMMSPDAGKRAEAVARNADYINACAAAGAKTFFICMVPEDPTRGRAENFCYMVESYSALKSTFEANEAYLVIEGWPGPGSLVCTPETYRAFIKQVGSPNMGVNYDPSHLVRMGIDSIRFLWDFVDHVFHVHGKDCMIINEQLYQYGNLQEATFSTPYKYGGMNWRYTIPGHGVSDWKIILNILKDNNYAGCVSIELEDHYYDDTEYDQKQGVLQGQDAILFAGINCRYHEGETNMKTATGNFPLGWRRREFAGEQDLDGMIAWAIENELEVIDLGRDADSCIKAVVEAGLRVGTADLTIWGEMMSPDAGKRAEAVARNADYINVCVAAGAKTFFICMLPEDSSRGRAENFGYMVESYSALKSSFEANDAYLTIEGGPGPGSLVCTPETYRAFIKQVGSPNMGVNYDPSHLVRMGIDPIRFLWEFVGHVFHVHGKDCMIINEQLYQYGNLQEATFSTPYKYGGMNWRYTIPGHGVSDWKIILKILKDNNYQGCVSIELEDHYYDDTEYDQKQGVLQGVKFLAGS